MVLKKELLLFSRSKDHQAALAAVDANGNNGVAAAGAFDDNGSGCCCCGGVGIIFFCFLRYVSAAVVLGAEVCGCYYLRRREVTVSSLVGLFC